MLRKRKMEKNFNFGIPQRMPLSFTSLHAPTHPRGEVTIIILGIPGVSARVSVGHVAHTLRFFASVHLSSLFLCPSV